MILKQLLFGTLVCATLGITSCGSDTEGTSTEQNDSTANTDEVDPTASSIQVNDTAATPAAAPATAAGMNPAHGEPGHRCDIPVGAPLNSPKAEPGAAQPIQIQQTPQPTGTPQPTAGGSGKVNPAHGQPGHDCKVAVGAPLP